MDLTDITFSFCKELPKEEKYNLIDQINRSSCSIVSNIAEGSGKRSKLEFAQFLSTALSSCYELETQLLICERRKYGNKDELNKAMELSTEIQKMIFAFSERIMDGKYNQVLTLSS